MRNIQNFVRSHGVKETRSRNKAEPSSIHQIWGTTTKNTRKAKPQQSTEHLRVQRGHEKTRIDWLYPNLSNNPKFLESIWIWTTGNNSREKIVERNCNMCIKEEVQSQNKQEMWLWWLELLHKIIRSERGHQRETLIWDETGPRANIQYEYIEVSWGVRAEGNVSERMTER